MGQSDGQGWVMRRGMPGRQRYGRLTVYTLIIYVGQPTPRLLDGTHSSKVPMRQARNKGPETRLRAI
jgi:hypothetical protein